jgi:N-acetyl-gamma-glutamyl-phosphate/LysW-gamma-L-alpha-aminoadipyl-6-phosphate reductase
MKVGVFGASGYVGGELLRLLLQHPKVELTTATSNRYAKEYVQRIHPNLRGSTNLKFIPSDTSKVADKCDFLFLATPHGVSSSFMSQIFETGLKIVDTSADFRLKDPQDYLKWYGWNHKCPELLKKAVYGLPEIHRKKIKKAQLVAGPGCMATSAILALAPIITSQKIDKEKIVADFKVGSSGAGGKPSLASHHAEHYSIVRAYKPVGHRHSAEINQELTGLIKEQIIIAMSAHAVNMVRGILATIHIFLIEEIAPIEIWRLYRNFYNKEPFIRLVKEKKGIFRYPDPKMVVGSNYCDLGFEIDKYTNRLVLLSAIDNLIKGAAGTAIQNMNIMCGWDENEGLSHSGLHPI